MNVTVNSNITPQILTVSSGGAKEVQIFVNSVDTTGSLNLQQYPNITLNTDPQLAQRVTNLELLQTPYTNTQTDETSLETLRTVYNLFEKNLHWALKKTVIDSNGNVTNTRAEGVENSATAWTNRLTLIYN